MLNNIYPIGFRFFFSFKGALIFCLLCAGIVSCKKSSNIGDDLKARLASGMVSYVEVGNVVTLNGSSYGFTSNYVGVPVTLTEPAKANDTITSVVDPSMVAQYNQLYLEKNPSFQPDAFQVSHQGIFPMASGTSQANDSLYVMINNGSQLKDSTLYLVPVTLAAKSGSKLKYSVFFFKIFVTVGSLKSKIYGGSVYKGTGFNRLSVGKALSASFADGYPDSVKFRTTLTTRFPANDTYVQVTMLTDSDLTVAVKQQNWTTSLLLPAANRSLTKDLSTIPAKSLLSKDSVTVKFYNTASLTKYKYYVTGVKIKTYAGSPYGVPPVANDSIKAYIRIFTQ